LGTISAFAFRHRENNAGQYFSIYDLKKTATTTTTTTTTTTNNNNNNNNNNPDVLFGKKENYVFLSILHNLKGFAFFSYGHF